MVIEIRRPHNLNAVAHLRREVEVSFVFYNGCLKLQSLTQYFRGRLYGGTYPCEPTLRPITANDDANKKKSDYYL